MKIIVQKFGGTSVATPEARIAVKDKVQQAIRKGLSPVVVVSAMGRKGAPYATDTLIDVLKNENISVNVREMDAMMCCGEIISAWIGPNGAGKSTVLNMITRLIPKDEGEIHFEGKDLTQWNSRELAKRIAILTQTNHVQMKLTVRELVAFGRFPYSGNRLTDEDKKMIDQAIAYMELEPFEDRFIDELSGGQRQRAYIAMVIAQDTEYIFFDEPTNNLDIYHATNMMKMVRRLCDELGKTVVLVLHEINYAAFYSDYICAFVDGKIAKFQSLRYGQK